MLGGVLMLAMFFVENLENPLPACAAAEIARFDCPLRLERRVRTNGSGNFAGNRHRRRVGVEAPEAGKYDAPQTHNFPGSDCCGERIGALAENCEVAAITEDATAPPSGDLLDDPQALEIGKRGVGRGR